MKLLKILIGTLETIIEINNETMNKRIDKDIVDEGTKYLTTQNETFETVIRIIKRMIKK